MRDVCQVDVIVSTRLKLLHPLAAATELFKIFAGCRILSAELNGPRLETTLLLPDLPGGYTLPFLKSCLEMGLYGTGTVFSSVHSLREATPAEILSRALARKPA